MNVYGSPTLLAHKAIQTRVNDIKSRLDDVRVEAVTGQVANKARAVDGNTGSINRLKEQIAYGTDRENVLKFEGLRASTGQDALSAIRAQTSDIAETLATALTHQTPQVILSVQTQAEGAVEDTISRLNTNFGGRALFGGDEAGAPLGNADDLLTQVRAVYAAAPDTATALTQINDWFNDAAGGFTTSFYQGGTGDPPMIELSKGGERVSPTVKGDDTALRNTLQAQVIAVLSKDAATVDDRNALLTASGDMLRQSVDDVVELQARLGVGEERMATTRAYYTAESTSLSIALNGLVGRDQAEAASEMRLMETQLEAAYMTTSRIANLTLTNYLR